MRFTITAKQFHLSDQDAKYIEKNVTKLLKFVPWNSSDYPQLNIILRSHKKRNRAPGRKVPIFEEPSYSPHGHEEMDSPVYYDGTLELTLPKKRLVAKITGINVSDALKDGFDELLRELDKYKGFHLENNSQYPDRRTIRQMK